MGKIRQRALNLLRLEHLFENKYGSRITIDIDPQCPYYNQFNVHHHELEKTGSFYCQLYNREPIPGTGKHYFEVKVLRQLLKMVIVGVITPDNFSQQYSQDKPNCICYNGFYNCIFLEGERISLDIATPKVNDVLRVMVEVPARRIQFIINQ